MTYFSKYDYTIIRKHWIVLAFRYLKFALLLSVTWVLYYFSIKFRDTIWEEIINIFVFPAIFFLVNYAFIKILLWYIKFYNDLLIIHDRHFIVIKSSLLFKDDIEIIDVNKITKLDTYCRWLIPNILSFWNLVVEQQRDEVREMHFVPEPFKALKLLQDEKQKILNDIKNSKNND